MAQLTISEARARLPELARMLVREPGSVAYITHRDLHDDLALTTRSHLEYLERALAELRERADTGFVMAGSVRATKGAQTLDAALDAIRQAAKEAQRARAASLE